MSATLDVFPVLVKITVVLWYVMEIDQILLCHDAEVVSRRILHYAENTEAI